MGNNTQNQTSKPGQQPQQQQQKTPGNTPRPGDSNRGTSSNSRESENR